MLPEASIFVVSDDRGSLLRVDSAASPALILRVHGELDLATASGLDDAVDQAIDQAIDRAAAGSAEVDLDLTGMTFCDVVGATAIERARRTAAGRGCRLTLVGGDGPLAILLASGCFPTLRSAWSPP